MIYRVRLSLKTVDDHPLSSSTSHTALLPQRPNTLKRQSTGTFVTYQNVKLVRNTIAVMDNISHITGLAKRVISQYLDLIPKDQLQTMDANIANSTPIDETAHDGEKQ